MVLNAMWAVQDAAGWGYRPAAGEGESEATRGIDSARADPGWLTTCIAVAKAVQD
jgi:hypothetical protein